MSFQAIGDGILRRFVGLRLLAPRRCCLQQKRTGQWHQRQRASPALPGTLRCGRNTARESAGSCSTHSYEHTWSAARITTPSMRALSCAHARAPDAASVRCPVDEPGAVEPAAATARAVSCSRLPVEGSPLRRPLRRELLRTHRHLPLVHVCSAVHFFAQPPQLLLSACTLRSQPSATIPLQSL